MMLILFPQDAWKKINTYSPNNDLVVMSDDICLQVLERLQRLL